MMSWKVRIETLSDFCMASGESVAGVVDTDILTDDYGIPYISARGFKGLMAEAMDDLIDFGRGSREIKESLLGIMGNDVPGKLFFGNSRLEDEDFYQKLDEMSESRETKKYTARDKVKDYFTYVRTQTRMDNSGIAVDGSMRTIRVGKRGMIFSLNIEALDVLSIDEERMFREAVALIRHIGSDRTRGLGNVQCSLEKTEGHSETNMKGAVQEAEIKDGKIGIHLTLMQDCILDTDYIPGRSLLGIFASAFQKNYAGNDKEKKFRDWFLRGDILFDMAYPRITDKVSGEKINFIPTPKSFYYDRKKAGDDVMDVWDMSYEEPETEDGDMKKYGLPYVAVGGDDVYACSVPRKVIYHHRRPSDKTIGHVLKKEEGDSMLVYGQLFQYEAIAAGTEFFSTIYGDEASLKELMMCVPNHSTVHVGKSRNAQYGQACLTYETAASVNEEVDEDDGWADDFDEEYPFVVMLQSPMILRNEDGSCKTDPKEIGKEILKQLDMEAADDSKIECWSQRVMTTGFNAHWRMPRAQETAFDSGTVIRIEDVALDAAQVEMLQKKHFGEKTSEGYGKVLLVDEGWMNGDEAGIQEHYRIRPYERQEKTGIPAFFKNKCFWNNSSATEFGHYLNGCIIQELMSDLNNSSHYRLSELRKYIQNEKMCSNSYLTTWIQMLASSDIFDEFDRQVEKAAERNFSEDHKKAYGEMKEQLKTIRGEFKDILNKDSQRTWEWHSTYVDEHPYEVFSEVIQNIFLDERNRRKISLTGSKGGASK